MRGTADLTVIPDKVFVRFSGASKHEDGYVTRLDYGLTHPGSGVPSFATGPNPKIGTLGGTAYTAGRVALRWVASPDIEVNLAGDYTDDKSEANAAVLVEANNPGLAVDGTPWVKNTITGAAIPYGCQFVPYGANSCDTLTGYNRKYVSYANFTDPTPANPQSPYKPVAFDPIDHLKSYGGQGTIDWDLGGSFKLKSITAYRHYENDYSHDEDGSPLPFEQVSYQLTHSQFSQEVRLNSSFLNGKLDTTVGGFYFHSKSTTGARVDLNYTDLDFSNGPDIIKVTSKAAFAQAIFHVIDGLNLTGGIRYTDDRKSYLYQRHNPDGSDVQPCTGYPFAPGQPPNCAINGLNGVTDSAHSGRFDYRAAVDYRFSKEILAYAQYSTGFKGGGVNPYPYYGPSSPYNQVKSFGPESLTTYEIGLKTDLFDRRVRINGAAFYNKYKNIIQELLSCNADAPYLPCDQPNNVGTANVKGIELEAQARPVDGLSFDGAFSYLDFKYTKVDPLAGLNLSDVTPYTPKYKWSVGAQYDYDVGPGLVSARMDGSYQSSVFSDPINGPLNQIPGYFVSNGRLSYTTTNKNWQIALEVRNIFNKYYYLTLIENYTPGSTPNYISGEPAKPRTWAVTLKRNF